MNKLLKHSKLIVVGVTIISIIFGIYFFLKLKNSDFEYLNKTYNMLNTNKIILHIMILSTSFLTSFFFLGTIIIFFFIILENISIGFIMSYFISIYKIKGLFYFLTYFIIYKLLIYFFLIILSIKYIKIFKLTINYIKKRESNITKTIINSLIIIISIITTDLFLAFLGDNILNLFSFIIK